MLNVPFVIEDVHGNVYPQAVIVISTMNVVENSNWGTSVVLNAGVPTYTTPTTNNHKSVNYQAFLFKDADAVMNEKRPMALRDKNGTDYFTFLVDFVPTNQEGKMALVEDHLLNTILPQLKLEV